MHCLSASDMAYILRAKDPFQIKACFPASHALRMIRNWELTFCYQGWELTFCD